MSTVIVTAVFIPREGKKQELIAAMERGIRSVHQEQGCELYAIHDAEDGTVTMLEKWSSEKDLNAHAEGAAIRVLQKDIDSYISAPPVVTRMLPLPVGDSDKGVL